MAGVRLWQRTWRRRVREVPLGACLAACDHVREELPAREFDLDRALTVAVLNRRLRSGQQEALDRACPPALFTAEAQRLVSRRRPRYVTAKNREVLGYTIRPLEALCHVLDVAPFFREERVWDEDESYGRPMD